MRIEDRGGKKRETDIERTGLPWELPGRAAEELQSCRGDSSALWPLAFNRLKFLFCVDYYNTLVNPTTSRKVFYSSRVFKCVSVCMCVDETD